MGQLAARSRLPSEAMGLSRFATMAPALLPKIGSRFLSLFGGLEKQQAKGHGVGLAIVRNVVARHGSRIRVTDNPGGGALFRMEFQLA
jgi:signal transduction histidine kinase